MLQLRAIGRRLRMGEMSLWFLEKGYRRNRQFIRTEQYKQARKAGLNIYAAYRMRDWRASKFNLFISNLQMGAIPLNTISCLEVKGGKKNKW